MEITDEDLDWGDVDRYAGTGQEEGVGITTITRIRTEIETATNDLKDRVVPAKFFDGDAGSRPYKEYDQGFMKGLRIVLDSIKTQATKYKHLKIDAIAEELRSHMNEWTDKKNLYRSESYRYDDGKIVPRDSNPADTPSHPKLDGVIDGIDCAIQIVVTVGSTPFEK